jgi:hypothetical protein
MLDVLRDLFVEHGKVTADLINGSGGPPVKSYAFRFNGIVAAMDLAGVSRPSLARSTITRYRMRCITHDMATELERCAIAANAQVEKISPRTYRLNGVTARLLCTRCRFERSHPCWKVTLAHVPVVDFVIWIRADQTNERVERIYLIPVADFSNRLYIWPSTRTLLKYKQYEYPSLAAMFGL